MVKCGHCSTRTRPVYHRTTKDVAFCGFQAARGTVHAANMAANPTPNEQEWTLKVPRSMVENIRDGRYAVSLVPGATEKAHFTFIRATHPPKNSRRKNCFVIQTQHAERYEEAIVFYPSGKFYIANHFIDQQLLMVAADPYTSAMKYGELMKRCTRCGTQLTDTRSRWYGIGPECEQYWPEIITYVNENKGYFVKER